MQPADLSVSATVDNSISFLLSNRHLSHFNISFRNFLPWTEPLSTVGYIPRPLGLIWDRFFCHLRVTRDLNSYRHIGLSPFHHVIIQYPDLLKIKLLSSYTELPGNTGLDHLYLLLRSYLYIPWSWQWPPSHLFVGDSPTIHRLQGFNVLPLSAPPVTVESAIGDLPPLFHA
jgi:hypothetical protein